MYDYIIVGSGLSGATFAHLAKEAGKKCLVIDKREHIGGNCYTKNIEGINVHVYGPHIFHTSNKNIWNFINKFSEFNHYVNRTKVVSKGNIYSFPINMMTLYQLWGVKTPDEAKKKLKEESQIYSNKYPNPRNMEEWALSQVGKEIYETFVYGYTTKQWKRTPDKLPASILKRLPIRLTWDDNYFDDCYQGIPKNGYTKIFENMLDGIEVKLGVDFFKEKSSLESMCKKIVYTGCIDQFYNYCYGELEYRTLKFDTQILQTEDFQGNAIFNYNDISIPWTRKIEHKHFEFLKSTKSVITTEYPVEWSRSSTPYYPVNDECNNSLYKKYEELSTKDKKYIFIGRLAKYKYFDMHQAIGASIKTFNNEI